VIVNFGCGANPAPSTSDNISIDGSLTVLLARFPLPAAAFGSRADFVRVIRTSRIRYGTARRLKLPKESVDGFYTSHVLEHLSTLECEDLLRQVRTWLKPSGVLRVVLPDLMRFARSYVAGTTDAPQFVASTNLSADGRHWWEILLGHSQHLWMYDAASFRQVLARLDFREIEECELGQGRSSALNSLDIPSRRAESFYIEAIK
jgi:predicted SAM-dependent methyltransferase